MPHLEERLVVEILSHVDEYCAHRTRSGHDARANLYALLMNFLRWHVIAAGDSCRLRERNAAATTIQSALRVQIARGEVAAYLRTRGPPAIDASNIIQRTFRMYRARKIVDSRRGRLRKQELGRNRAHDYELVR